MLLLARINSSSHQHRALLTDQQAARRRWQRQRRQAQRHALELRLSRGLRHQFQLAIDASPCPRQGSETRYRNRRPAVLAMAVPTPVELSKSCFYVRQAVSPTMPASPGTNAYPPSLFVTDPSRVPCYSMSQRYALRLGEPALLAAGGPEPLTSSNAITPLRFPR